MFDRFTRLALVAALVPASVSARADVQVAAPADLLQAFNVHAGELQNLSFRTAGDQLVTEVELAGEVVELVLWEHSMRSDDYQLLVQDATGALVPTEPSPVTTFRGTALGYPDSSVAGSYRGGTFVGLVRLGLEAEIWSVESAHEIDDSYAPAAHLVFSSEEQHLEGVCGTDTSDVERFLPGASISGAPDGGNQLVLELACDTDVEFFNDNGGSVANTENSIQNTLNGVAGIYLSQIDVLFTIGTVIIRTSNPDPYTTNNASALLSEFQNHWISQQQAVDRDLAHMFTGRNMSGGTIGIAYLSGVCSNADGYGLHENIFGFNNRVSVCAHEIGHNFSAGHCNGNPGGCNIMCSFLGGCGGQTQTFAPPSINQISNFAMFASCLDDPTPPGVPVLSAVVPAQMPTLVPGPGFHATLLGSNLDTVTDVVVGGVSLGGLFPPGYEIIDENTINFKMPLLPNLGITTAEVINVTGTDTRNFEVVPASPPSLQLGVGADPETLLSISPVEITASGQPGNVIFLWASFTLAPTIAPGTFTLDIGNNFLDLILVDFPVVEPSGWVDRSYFGATLPPVTTIYFQAFEYDVVTGTLPVESTNVQEGLWLF